MGILQKLKDTKSFLENVESVEDQSFADVVLEAAGVNIPLPTEDEVIEFYTEIKEPANPLTKINPEEWTTSQFLAYQSDVRKFQAKNRFKGIKDARKLKEEKEKEKQEKERKKFKLDFITGIFKDVQKDLNENIPEDQKPKGVQKLGQLAGNITKVLAKTCLPAILNIIEQTALDTFEAKKAEVREELGIDEQLEQLSSLTDPAKLQEVKDRLCPTQDVLENIIRQRDGIVDFLNNQQEKVNNLKISADVTGDAVNVISDILLGTNISIFILNEAAQFFAIDSPIRTQIERLSRINTVIEKDRDGNPRIPPLKGAVSNFSVPLNGVNTMITKIVQALAPIDEIITLCSPNSTLNELSDDVLITTAVQLSAGETDDGSLYKGFRLEIEEKPYTDTVTQRRAVGLNASGVVLIASEFSFASDPQVLINEIKFIIDRDNLKAY
tara:strand:+ start:1022 stop:2341 length:1320 start_codon:yes stop_codon:yes gene_type:complete